MPLDLPPLPSPPPLTCHAVKLNDLMPPPLTCHTVE